MAYEKLLQPGTIGSVRTRNRLVKTGASTCYWHSEHTHMAPKALAFYGALAKGGVGLLIVEAPVVDWPTGARWMERYRIDDDRFLPGLTELADEIHSHGCPTFLQLWHDGPWQNPLFEPPATYEGPPVGASAINLDAPGDFHRDKPRPLTVSEIEVIVEKFGAAAGRAQRAGFDGVCVNAASSHILHNFMSPFWNRRDDEYGGSVENRARFTVEVLRSIRRHTGPGFGIDLLVNGIEFGRAFNIDDATCLSHEDALRMAQLYVDAGADSIQVRNHWLGYHVGGFFPDYLFYPDSPIPTSQFPKEYNWQGRGAAANLYLARSMKKAVSVPVLLVGKLTPELGEQYLQDGSADFIAMTRRLQADPELPNKLVAGRRDDVAPCTACGTCLDQSVSMERRCRINASMATTEYSLKPAATRKKVVVVGAGPSGMEAARVAAERGHDVTLIEKTLQFGGLMSLAALVKGVELEDLPSMVAYHERQLRRLGVTLEMGRPADAASLAAMGADVVVLATGGSLTVPPLPGVGGPNVLTTPQLHAKVKPFLRRLGPRVLGRMTKYWLPVGRRVAVIGGGLHGCEVAEFLLKRGRSVVVIEPSDAVGEGVLDFRLGLLMDWFSRQDVELITGAGDITITHTGVAYTLADGARRAVTVDTVLPTAPLAGDPSLLAALQGTVPEVYAVGDCASPGMIVDAVAAGWRVASNI